MEWVATSERLPVGPAPVLCYVFWPTMSMHTMAVLYMWGPSDYRQWCEMDGRHARCAVTHWMALPDAPGAEPKLEMHTYTHKVVGV